MNLKQEPTVNFLIIIGAFLLTGIILYFLISELDSQAAKTQNARRTIQENASSIDFLSYYKKEKVTADKYGSAMELLLPAKDDLLQFPQWLENIARSKRLEPVIAFDGDPVSPKVGPGYINFNLTLDGNLEAIDEFMGLIENNSDQYLIQISSIDLSKADGGRYRSVSKGKVFFSP